MSVDPEPTIQVTTGVGTITVTVPQSTIKIEDEFGEGTTVVVDGEVETIVVEETPTVSVLAIGIMGPPGPAGATGGAFLYDQAVPASTWNILHGLGYWPNVTVVDTLGRFVIGDVQYPDIDHIVLTFSAAFSGRAFLS